MHTYITRAIELIHSSVYCIVLLSILFVSSCYWSPILTSSPLTTPWSNNITTFGEALVANMNASTLEELSLPKYIRPVDRCWCDLGSGSLFEPFNTTRWEEASVLRAKHELEKNLTTSLDNMDQGVDMLLLNDNSTTSSKPAATAPTSNDTSESPHVYRTTMSGYQALWYFICETYHQWRRPIERTNTRLVSKENRAAEIGLKPLRKVYDLRSHGFDIIVDFRWSRSN